jgi:CubicO group peptidase (beta-lactamase class C family)
MSLIEGISIVKPEDIGFSSQRLARICLAMQEYIDRQEAPGIVTIVARHGKVAHFEAQGMMDIEKRIPMARDSIFRMYSMTKPITSLAVLMLYEEGHFQLEDPISNFIPAFKNPLVITLKPPFGMRHWRPRGYVYTEPADREITIRDLLTHSAGLASPRRTPAALYNQLANALQGTIYLPLQDGTVRPKRTIAEMVERLANIPLSFHPGTSWEYGREFDVLGVLVETISGKTLDEFFKEKIFEPIGMHDTSFYLPEVKVDRFTTSYTWDEEWKIRVFDTPATSEKVKGPKTVFSGMGDFGGVLSTAPDYARFIQVLLNCGILNGVRLLSRKTVDLMTSNHTGSLCIYLRGSGWGYGLGVGVHTSLIENPTVGSVGSYGWGGAACTYFFVDPKEDLFGVALNQVYGYGFKPNFVFGPVFEELVYQALE